MIDQEAVDILARNLYEEAHEGDPVATKWEDLKGYRGRVLRLVWMEAARKQIEELMADPGGEE